MLTITLLASRHTTTSRCRPHAAGNRDATPAGPFVGVQFCGRILILAIMIFNTTIDRCAGATAALTVSLPTNRNRTQLCQRAGMLVSGTTTTSMALSGMNITMAIQLNTPVAMMNVSNITGLPVSGLMYDLHNELQSRGNFTIEYVLVPNMPSTYTTTTWLQKILPHVDMFANTWYSDTAASRALGIGFTQRVVDASLVLVTVKTTVEPTRDIFNFLRPFTNNLWLCIGAVVLANGIIHKIVNPHDGGGQNKKPVSIMRSIYSSFAQYVYVGSMSPQMYGGMFLNAGYSFFLIIVMAAYSANLTTILVNNIAKTTIPVVSIDAANSLGARICAMTGSTSLSVLQSSYPRIQAIPISTTEPAVLLAMMKSGSCSAAVLGQNEWDYTKNSLASNLGCNLVQVGSTIRVVNGAWPYLVDYSNYCTSLVETTISSLLVRMNQDNSLPSIYQSSLDASSDTTCPGILTVTDGSTSALGFTQLAGIFAVYVVTVGLTLLVLAFDLLFSYPTVSKRVREERRKASKYVREVLMPPVLAKLDPLRSYTPWRRSNHAAGTPVGQYNDEDDHSGAGGGPPHRGEARTRVASVDGDEHEQDGGGNMFPGEKADYIPSKAEQDHHHADLNPHQAGAAADAEDDRPRYDEQQYLIKDEAAGDRDPQALFVSDDANGDDHHLHTIFHKDRGGASD